MDDPESPIDNDLYHIALACRSIITAIDRVTKTGEVRVQSQAVDIMLPHMRRKTGGHTYQYDETRYLTAARVLDAMSRGDTPTAENLKTARTYFVGLADDCDSARFGP